MANPAQTYAKNAQETGNIRELEAQLLMRAASKLQAVKDGEVTGNTDIISAVRYNRRLWLAFADALTSAENKLPEEIKKNVTSLALFVLNRSRTIETAAEPDPNRVGILININREIAAGLRANVAA
jgi:flagellar protein FlaF